MFFEHLQGGNVRRFTWLSMSSMGDGPPKKPKVGRWASRELAQWPGAAQTQEASSTLQYLHFIPF